MARKVTQSDIKLMNELYYKYKTYAEVARQTGFSSSTVSKYIDKTYTPIDEQSIVRFDINELPQFDTSKLIDNFNNLGCIMLYEPDEIVQLLEVRREIQI